LYFANSVVIIQGVGISQVCQRFGCPAPNMLKEVENGC
jgi:hypothetical protein